MQIEKKMAEYEASLTEMGERVQKAMRIALESLNEGNKEKALRVIEMDEFINLEEASINDQAIEILSLLQPVARDLRFLVAGIKVATDFERIGDYAKNIGRFVIKSDEMDGPMKEEVMELGEIFLANFEEILKVFKTLDVKQAYHAASLDENLDEAFKKLIRHLTQSNKTETFPAETVAMIRNIERAGDHGKNICEQIVYITKGQHIDLG